MITLIDALESKVGDLENPAAVDDAVAGLEVAVDFDRTYMQISHSLHQSSTLSLSSRPQSPTG